MNLLLFGCSHSWCLWTSSFENKIPNSYRMSLGGNANMKIIRDVYDYVNSENFNVDKDILLIQYSYTNRLWLNNKFNNTFSFHSTTVDTDISKEYSSSTTKSELKKFYELYLKYFWEYDLAMETLLIEIDKLKTYLESKNIKFIHYLWSDTGNDGELFKELGEKPSKFRNDLINKLNELGCETIDGFHFAEEWAYSLDNKSLGAHISDELNDKLRDILLNILSKKFNYTL